MNLGEFIKLRSNCPICDSGLITKFISDRKQIFRYNEDRFVAVHTLRGMKVNQQDYQVGYSFGLNDNSFCVEFYTEWNTHEQVPLHLIDKFKEFHKNVSVIRYRFSRRCNFCNQYMLRSAPINIDLKTGTINSVEISFEAFVWASAIQGEYKVEGCKVIMLGNLYPPEYNNTTSELRWWRTTDSEVGSVFDSTFPYPHSELIGLPQIPFVSKEETYKRLNNLITFA